MSITVNVSHNVFNAIKYIATSLFLGALTEMFVTEFENTLRNIELRKYGQVRYAGSWRSRLVRTGAAKSRTRRILLALTIVLFAAEIALEFGTGSSQISEETKVPATIFLNGKDQFYRRDLKVDTSYVEEACSENFGHEFRVWQTTWVKNSPEVVQNSSNEKLTALVKGACPSRQRGEAATWKFTGNLT